MARLSQGYYSLPMNSTLIVVSFSVFLLAFTAIGALASRKKRESSEDYLLASRDVNPWLVALSAVSTNNSGYMFIGLIGYTWQAGIQAVWISVGWVFGDFLTWFWVHKRVRKQSESVGAKSVPGLLATDADGKVSRPIALAAGVLTFFFLGGCGGTAKGWEYYSKRGLWVAYVGRCGHWRCDCSDLLYGWRHQSIYLD